MKNKQEKIFNKIVGISESGTIIMIRSVFNYTDGLHGQPFYGAQYAEFAPISQDYIDEMNEIDRLKDEYDYLWREAVASKQTECSLEEYMQDIIDENEANGSYFLGHDDSYIHDIPESFKEEYFPDAVTFQCIGCGRMSSHKKYDKVFDQELIDLADSFEFGTNPKLEVFK